MFGIALAKDAGIVQVVLAPTPVAIVPLYEPIEYVSVCVKLELALLVLIVIVLPIVVPLTEGVEALGIVVNPKFPERLKSPWRVSSTS